MNSPERGPDRSKPRVDFQVNAIVPLAIFRALQKLDHTDPIDLEEFAGEVAPKRLGMSATVSAQIERYGKLVKTGGTVPVDEVVQLFRLVGRRNDAELAFSEAGRMAAEEVIRQTSAASRLVHRAGKMVARQRASTGLAVRLSDRLLRATMSLDEKGRLVAFTDIPLTESVPDGKACGFFGAALAELLRQCTDFQGAMLHESCRARGDDVCSWRSGAAS